MSSSALALRLSAPSANFRFNHVANDIGRLGRSQRTVPRLEDYGFAEFGTAQYTTQRSHEPSKSASVGGLVHQQSRASEQPAPKKQAAALPAINRKPHQLATSSSAPALAKTYAGADSPGQFSSMHEFVRSTSTQSTDALVVEGDASSSSSQQNVVKFESRFDKKPRVIMSDEDFITDELELEGHEKAKALLRRAFIKKVGTPAKAFRALDVNASEMISLQDFASGLSKCGIDWKALTGTRTERQCFTLFYKGKRGAIIYNDVFPQDCKNQWADLVEEPRRPNTTEFFRKWCDKTDPQDMTVSDPKWQVRDPGTRVDRLTAAQDAQEEAYVKKKWVQATFRRLKGKGKSDARSRELCALHLPRGSGPADRQEVNTFSHKEVVDCKKKYQEEVNDPAKNIQKAVSDMRDTRKVLLEQRQVLHRAMGPHLKAAAMEEKKNEPVYTSMGGMFGKAARVPSKKLVKSFAQMAAECGSHSVTEEIVEDMYVVWCNHCHPTDELIKSKADWLKVMADMCPFRTLSPSDIEVHWGELFSMSKTLPREKGSEKDELEKLPNKAKHKSQKNGALVTFEHFAKWFTTSEFLVM